METLAFIFAIVRALSFSSFRGVFLLRTYVTGKQRDLCFRDLCFAQTIELEYLESFIESVGFYDRCLTTHTFWVTTLPVAFAWSCCKESIFECTMADVGHPVCLFSVG